MEADATAQDSSLAAAIRAEIPLMAMLGGPEQSAALEAGIADLGTEPIGFVRIGNPLVSPLSMERVVLQITRDAVEEERLDDAERVLRALVARSGERQLVVVVEQAETLTAGAYAFLAGLTTLRHPGLARVQVVLAGTPALAARTAGDRVHVVGADPLPAPDGSAPPLTTAIPPAPAPPVRRRSRALVLALAGLGACGGIALLLTTERAAQPEAGPAPAVLTPSAPVAASPAPDARVASAPTVQVAPVPVTQVAPVTVTQVAPVPVDATPPPEPPAPVQPPPPLPLPVQPLPAQAAPVQEPQAEAPSAASPATAPSPVQETAAAERERLYREFNAFLGRRSLGRQLTQAERGTLFQEYLARRQAAPSPSRIPGEPHVVLFFAAGSDPDLVVARREAEELRPRVAGLDMQPVPEVPAVPTIRYAFPADRPAALALAQTLRTKAGEWLIEDRTNDPSPPEAGTIEVWLPRE